jgi:hypothetical protein
MKLLLVSFLLVSSFQLIAGDKVGNGGDVVVCPQQKTLLLDIYQGRADWGMQNLQSSGERSQIIRDTLKDFHKIDTSTSRKILERAFQIEADISRLERLTESHSALVRFTSKTLVNISDEGVAEIPSDCKIIQAATQIQSPFPGEVKFTFQKEIWLSLESDVQASLILHEVIYELMITSGEESSRSTRYFNAALHAGELNSVKEYFDLSSLFEFKNLTIKADGKSHVFGFCSVKRERFKPGNSQQLEGTTITLGSKNVVTRKENFQDAINYFWKKIVKEGLCN